MGTTYKTIWEFKTKNFRVTLACTPDYDVDLSWDDTGDTLAKLESGEWCAYVFRVAVYDQYGHEIGADYLGGSIYADPAQFIDHRECGKQNREWAAQGKIGRCGSYFTDMLHEAIGQARKAYNQPRTYLRHAGR